MDFTMYRHWSTIEEYIEGLEKQVEELEAEVEALRNEALEAGERD